MSFVGKWFGYGRNPHYDEGVRAYERGDDEAAAECFRICLSSEPEPSARERAKNYLAGSLGRMANRDLDAGDTTSAVKHLASATQLRPHFADLRRKYAFAFLLAGELDQARAEVNAALLLNPKYGHALALLAALTLHSGQVESALDLARQARKADPRLPESVLTHVEAMLDEGKNEHAIGALSEWNPDPAATVEGQTAQADAHMKKMHWSEAELLYREALTLQPRYADIRLKHAQSLMELGELADAANAFREALTLNPNLAEAHALLGVTLRRQGDESGSRKCFKAAVSLDPDHPIASAELMRLRGLTA